MCSIFLGDWVNSVNSLYVIPAEGVTHLFYVLLAQICGSGLPTSYAFTGCLHGDVYVTN